MADQKIGQLLDSLGVTAELSDGDMPTDALVVLKVVTPEGRTAVTIATSEASDWVTQKGLLAAAAEISEGEYTEGGD